MESVLWQDQEKEILLQTPAEFCFEECLAFLARSANECTHEVRDGAVYKALKVDGEVVALKVDFVQGNAVGDAFSEPDFTPEPGTLRITFLTPPPKQSIRAATARYVRDWFDLDTDLRPFYEMAHKDSLLRPLVEAHFGLRLLGYPDLFEAVTWAFIGQQVNLAFAYTLKRRLVETFGEQVQHEGHAYWLFPTPEALASASVEQLTTLKLIRQRAEYVIGFAKLMVEGHVSKANLSSSDLATMRKALLSIRGVGPWTAEYVLMKCLNQRAAFPVQDAALQNALKQGLGLDEKPSQATIRERATGWTGWEAYATFYLWRSLLKIELSYEKISKIV